MSYVNGRYTNAAYSYEETCTYLAKYKEALDALVDGQVQEYTIGSRSVTLLNVSELEAMVAKFAAIKAKYEAAKRPTRNVAIVPRDM